MNVPTLNIKYIRAEEAKDTVNGKPIFNVLNRKSGDELARVFWYPAWRRWCWTQSQQNVVFSDDCSDAIGAFCRELTQCSR